MQDNFFAQAYRTGTDSWTNIPFKRRAHELTLYLPKGSLILDIGAGRGRLLYDLAKLGFRAIGLENNQDLIVKGNSEVKAKHLEKEIRFLQGSILNIPLADQSFDAVADVGLFHHILPEDYKTYASEVARVLKQGGFAFLIILSKKTANYLSWHPQEDDEPDYEREGTHYHFFSEEELHTLFDKDFEFRQLDYDTPFGPTDATYAVVLLRKK